MNPKEQAIQNDKRIIDCAIYYMSEGQTVDMNLRDPDIARTLQEKFNYFKLLVRTGEITINELEDKVFAEFGVGVKNQRRMIGFSSVDDEEMQAIEKEIFSDEGNESKHDREAVGRRIHKEIPEARN